MDRAVNDVRTHSYCVNRTLRILSYDQALSLMIKNKKLENNQTIHSHFTLSYFQPKRLRYLKGKPKRNRKKHLEETVITAVGPGVPSPANLSRYNPSTRTLTIKTWTFSCRRRRMTIQRLRSPPSNDTYTIFVKLRTRKLSKAPLPLTFPFHAENLFLDESPIRS